MSKPEFFISKDPTKERKKMDLHTKKDKENLQQQKVNDEYNKALNSGKIAKKRSKKRGEKVMYRYEDERGKPITAITNILDKKTNTWSKNKTNAERNEEYKKLMAKYDAEMNKGGKRTRRKRKRRRKRTKKKRKRKRTKKKRRKRRKRTKKSRY